MFPPQKKTEAQEDGSEPLAEKGQAVCLEAHVHPADSSPPPPRREPESCATLWN